MGNLSPIGRWRRACSAGCSRVTADLLPISRRCHAWGGGEFVRARHLAAGRPDDAAVVLVEAEQTIRSRPAPLRGCGYGPVGRLRRRRSAAISARPTPSRLTPPPSTARRGRPGKGSSPAGGEPVPAGRTVTARRAPASLPPLAAAPGAGP